MTVKKKNYCGAKTRAGTPCTQIAGWGTKHVGTGRCKLHGGNAGRPPIHGLYSRALKEHQRELYEYALNSNQIKRLREEIALMRVRLVGILECKQFVDDPAREPEQTMMIAKLCDKIGGLVQRAAHIEDGMKVIKTHELQIRVAQMVIEVLKEEFAGDEDKARSVVEKIIRGLERQEEASA